MNDVPLDEWNGSKATSKATRDLQATIERIERQNARQQVWMLVLTAVAAVAALIAAWPVIKGWFGG